MMVAVRRWRQGESVRRLAGRLIAIEGIDQAGKQTVCERLAARLRAEGVATELAGFPDYSTPLGREIAAFLRGERSFAPEARQLLYAANRWERAGEIREWLAAGRAVVVDRYTASGIAYGTAQGLDPEWMAQVERGLPAAELTLLLDITPEVSAARKTTARDAYEAQAGLLARARAAYLDLARVPGWQIVDATGNKDSAWAGVLAAVAAHLASV